MLLVLGMLLLWVTVSIDARMANTVSLSCEELEECFEDELEEDAQKLFSAVSLHDSSILEVETACLMQFLRTIDVSNTDNPSGWMMPLRI